MFREVLSGAAGTGKTTLVFVMEQMHDYFFGTGTNDSTFAKTAPTNTAARIGGGDTCHAFYKLPLHNLAGKRGKLSPPVTAALRKVLKLIVGQVIDEMSMLTPQLNYQIAYRCKEGQAGGYNDTYAYGGIGTTLAGDFMQLPPVRKAGLAKDIPVVEGQQPQCDEDQDDMTGIDVVEHKHGFALWRSFDTAVSLTLNLRATGMLSTILKEMRDGRLSDDSWTMLKDRVLKVRDREEPPTDNVCFRDPRLDRPPFSTNEVYYAFHRHVLRSTQTYIHAIQMAASTREPCFICCAADLVSEDDKHLWDDEVRGKALHYLQARECKRSPGVLPLRRKGRYQIFSKACVRLGLMNGCEVILEDIHFHKEERLPVHYYTGAAHICKYLPESLLVRVPGVAWSLHATHHFPYLPPEFDRRGLVLLQPEEVFFKMDLSGAVKNKLQVKRYQFKLAYSNARTSYGAQGEQPTSSLLKEHCDGAIWCLLFPSSIPTHPEWKDGWKDRWKERDGRKDGKSLAAG
jgi:hypothetical protein